MDENATRQKIKFSTKKLPARRNFLATFFISFTWGVFGADRMYLGKWGTGILKLVTVGGYGLWLVIDLMRIANGDMRDAWGRGLHGSVEYQPFVKRFSLVVAIVALALAVIVGIVLFLALSFAYKKLIDSGIMDGLGGSSAFNLDGIINGY